MHKQFFAVPVGLIAVLVLAACGSSSSTSSSSPTPAAATTTPAATTTSSAAATSAPAAAGASTIVMKDNFFAPAVVKGKPGQTVKVTLKNEGTTEHNFKIDGQAKADADVGPGKTGTAVVKIPASGTLQFYCEYHKSLGMVGTVKVS